MITKFGKELRKLRLDLGITLYEMATQIGVSPSMLSSAETGKKTASPALVDRLAQQYAEINLRKDEFQQLAQETLSEVRIKLTEDNERRNNAALAFARNFDRLSETQLDQLMSIFNQPKKG